MAINQISSLRMDTKFKKTPIGEIPVEWNVTKLGNSAHYRNGHGFKPSEWAAHGIPIIRIQNLNGSEDFNYFDGKLEEDWLVKPGDLLFSWSGSRGTSFGPFLWRGGKGVLNQHIFNVLPVEGVDKGFLFYYLRQITGEIEHRAHGSAGLVHITKQELSAFDFPVPPLDEQKKIAEILSSVDDAIQKADAVIAKTRDLKKALMQRLLTRGIGHTKFKKSPIGEIPVEWEVSRLGDIAGMFSGGTPSRNRPEYFGGGIPWVKSGELNPGYVTATEETISEQGLNASSAKWVTENSILLALYGATAGQIALLKIKATINQAVLAIIPKEEAIHTSFLYYALRAQIERLISITQGSGQPNLNQDVVSSLELTIPPFAEQKKIAKILSSVDDAIEKSESERDHLEQTKKSLMADLLTGRVRTT